MRSMVMQFRRRRRADSRARSRALLAVAAATCLLGCSCDSASDTPDIGTASDLSQQTDVEQISDAGRLPRSSYLQRMGAAEGGIWVGRVDGARVILRISGDEDACVVEEYGSDENDVHEFVYYLDYLAVLLDNEHPRARVFSLTDVSVESDGFFVLDLTSLSKEASLRSVTVDGTVVDGVLRVDDQSDKDGVIPSGLTLEPSTGKVDVDEARLRAFLEMSIKRHLGLDESRDR